LIAIALAVFGLCLSLFIRPRRVWVRLTNSGDGTSLVEVAGLDRADARAGLDDDVSELANILSGATGTKEPGRT
jgi:cytochrome c biogenesis protein